MPNNRAVGQIWFVVVLVAALGLSAAWAAWLSRRGWPWGSSWAALSLGHVGLTFPLVYFVSLATWDDLYRMIRYYTTTHLTGWILFPPVIASFFVIGWLVLAGLLGLADRKQPRIFRQSLPVALGWFLFLGLLFCRDWQGPIDLVRGVEKNHHYAVRRMLSSQPSQQSKDEALLKVPFYSDAQMGRLLIEAGADPYHKDSVGRTCLDHALMKGLADQAVVYLAKMERVDSQVALPFAAEMGRPELVQALLQKGVAVDSNAPGRSRALISCLGKPRSREIAKVLIEHGASLEKLPDDGMLPLLDAAVCRNDPLVLRLLLEQKLDINCRSRANMTPLISAAFYGHSECVKILLEHGANQSLKDDHGRTALSAATKPEIRRMLTSSKNND